MISLDLSKLNLRIEVISEFDLCGDHWMGKNVILILNFFIFQACSLRLSNHSSLDCDGNPSSLNFVSSS